VLKKKYVIVVPDGAADYPIPELGGKTIFEAAETPNLDGIAASGMLGLSKTVPDGLQPGSDVAMMAVLGYNPKLYYTGRAPIEAAAQGIEVGPADWVFRCNLVTFRNETMADHSAGQISSEEGKVFVDALNASFADDRIKFYPGVAYRHLLVVKGLDFQDTITRPPHDNIGKSVESILPLGKNSDFLVDLIKKSRALVENHPINQARKKLGKNSADSIWLWGQGRKAALEPFEKIYGLKGAAITAVDLVRGLAKLIDFDWIQVNGATGYFDTNYRAKGIAAIEALHTHDIVLVHVEATDEAGHEGKAEVKKKALESIDAEIIGPVLEELKKYSEWRILVMPDHPTPVSTKGHVGNPVPFAIGGSDMKEGSKLSYSEANAAKTGIFIDPGYGLMKKFLE
jgi:2,3-bisphosphoglycerate-independent phosphoglycerate mutase